MKLPRPTFHLALGALLLLGACSSPATAVSGDSGPPVPASQTRTEGAGLTLSLRQTEAGAASFELSMRNDGPEGFTIVRPRPDRLARYESWGGWILTVTDGPRHYHPYPLPGPFIPATSTDLLILAPGETSKVVLSIEDFVLLPLSDTPPLGREGGQPMVKVAWEGLPGYLKAAPPALPAAATLLLSVTAASGSKEPQSGR